MLVYIWSNEYVPLQQTIVYNRFVQDQLLETMPTLQTRLALALLLVKIEDHGLWVLMGFGCLYIGGKHQGSNNEEQVCKAEQLAWNVELCHCSLQWDGAVVDGWCTK